MEDGKPVEVVSLTTIIAAIFYEQMRLAFPESEDS